MIDIESKSDLEQDTMSQRKANSYFPPKVMHTQSTEACVTPPAASLTEDFVSSHSGTITANKFLEHTYPRKQMRVQHINMKWSEDIVSKDRAKLCNTNLSRNLQ